MKYHTKLFLIAVLIAVIFPAIGLAQERAKIDISIPCISCKNASGDNPVGLIADFYELALALSGVLALGMIIYAGILRVTSANSPSKVSESNDIIFNALLGIVLLFGAYILLNTINPELTKLEIPQLSKIEIKEQAGGYSCYDADGAAVKSCHATADECAKSCESTRCVKTAFCAPSGSGCDVSNWPDLAKKNNEPYPKKNAPATVALMSCIRGKVSGNLGQISTFDVSHEVCNYTRGQRSCGSCSHAVNSCHYGGRSGTEGSLGIDYGNEANGDAIIKAAKECGAKDARCENASGQRVGCSAGANHVHVTVAGCDAN